MQEQTNGVPGRTREERDLNRNLLIFLNKYNCRGNLVPPKKADVKKLEGAINTFYSGINKSVRIEACHMDLSENGSHFVTNVLIDNRLSLSFDPNGKHSPNDCTGKPVTKLNQTNLHKKNGREQGECGLWCIAAMVEIEKETSERAIITKAKSKKLTRRIAARFINLKQTMVDKSKFISLGDNLSEDLVNTLLQEGQEFIREEGMRFLSGQIQQNQARSVPQHNVLSTAARTIISGGNRFRLNGNPQAVETPPDSEFKTIKKSKPYNNILEVLKQGNMQKLAENMQITKTPTKNKGHEI